MRHLHFTHNLTISLLENFCLDGILGLAEESVKPSRQFCSFWQFFGRQPHVYLDHMGLIDVRRGAS